MLIDFLRRLYDNRLLMDNPGDYGRLAEEIEVFSVHSQLYTLLQERGRLVEVPEWFRQQLKTKYDKVFYQNMLLRHEGEALLRTLNAAEIPVIPLKGTRFAERWFGHFAARGTSDIDILVKPTHIVQAILCIKSLGYTESKEERRSNNHCSFTKQTKQAAFTLAVELHWNLEKDYASSLDMDRIWRSATPVEGFPSIYELAPADTFYYICLHGARHQMESVKYFIDVVQLLERLGSTLDLSAMVKQAARDRTRRRMLYVLQTVYRQFPSLQERIPLPDSSGFRLWSYKQIRAIWTGEKRLSYYSYQMAVKLHDGFFIYDTWKHRLLSIPLISLLFPPPGYIIYTMEIDQPDRFKRLQLYRKLYRKRWKQLFAVFTKRSQEEAPHVHDVHTDRRASG